MRLGKRISNINHGFFDQRRRFSHNHFNTFDTLGIIKNAPVLIA